MRGAVARMAVDLSWAVAIKKKLSHATSLGSLVTVEIRLSRFRISVTGSSPPVDRLAQCASRSRGSVDPLHLCSINPRPDGPPEFPPRDDGWVQVSAGRRINFDGLAFASKAIL